MAAEVQPKKSWDSEGWAYMSSWVEEWDGLTEYVVRTPLNYPDGTPKPPGIVNSELVHLTNEKRKEQPQPPVDYDPPAPFLSPEP